MTRQNFTGSLEWMRSKLKMEILRVLHSVHMGVPSLPPPQETYLPDFYRNWCSSTKISVDLDLVQMTLCKVNYYWMSYHSIAGINAADIMSTPSVKVPQYKKDNFRTPGQILSLTTDFAFVSCIFTWYLYLFMSLILIYEYWTVPDHFCISVLWGLLILG